MVCGAEDNGHWSDPAAFAVAANLVVSSRNASVARTHTTRKTICMIGFGAPDRASAVPVVLAVVVATVLKAEPLSRREDQHPGTTDKVVHGATTATMPMQAR
jgi:hypothetical protein